MNKQSGSNRNDLNFFGIVNDANNIFMKENI